MTRRIAEETIGFPIVWSDGQMDRSNVIVARIVSCADLNLHGGGDNTDFLIMAVLSLGTTRK